MIVASALLLLHFKGCCGFYPGRAPAKISSVDMHHTTNPDVIDVEMKAPLMQVYIEDTDAYGVVYNTNYIRAYERALHWFGSSSGVASELLKSQDWVTVKVEKHRFKKSAALGDDFVVSGSRKYHSLNMEVWELEMANPESGTVYNSALITVGSQLHSPPALEVDGFSLLLSDNYLLYRDEFDINLHGRLPIRNVMNAFERSRSNSLGGPDVLRSLQVDDGLIAVVSRIDHAALIHDDTVICHPGSTVAVSSLIQVKRRGMIRFLHTMWAEDSNGVRRRVAQAIVVLMILDATTRKPTSAFPDWLNDRLSASGDRESSL